MGSQPGRTRVSPATLPAPLAAAPAPTSASAPKTLTPNKQQSRASGLTVGGEKHAVLVRRLEIDLGHQGPDMEVYGVRISYRNLISKFWKMLNRLTFLLTVD